MEDDTNLKKITHNEFIRIAESLIQSANEQKIPPPSMALLGKPGIGKSDIVRLLAQRLNAELRIYIPSRRNPNTTTGIPWIENKENEQKFAKWIPFEEFNFPDDKKQYILFIDELPNAPPIVQSCLLGVILDRQLEQFKIPDNVLIIAAGNLSTDSKASFDLIEPMPSRLALFQLLPPSVEDWTIWAQKNHISSYVISFLYQHRNLLCPSETKGILYPTPRGWARAGKYITDAMSEQTMTTIISAFVGEAAATQYKTWIKIKNKLPDIEKAFYGEDPKWKEAIKIKEEGTDSIGVIIFVLTSLASSNLISNIKQSQKFIDSLPYEFQPIAFRLFRTNKAFEKLVQNEEYFNWLIDKINEWDMAIDEDK